MWKMIAESVSLRRKLLSSIRRKKNGSVYFYAFVLNIHYIFDQRNEDITIRLTKHAVVRIIPHLDLIHFFYIQTLNDNERRKKTKINKFFLDLPSSNIDVQVCVDMWAIAV